MGLFVCGFWDLETFVPPLPTVRLTGVVTDELPATKPKVIGIHTVVELKIIFAYTAFTMAEFPVHTYRFLLSLIAAFIIPLLRVDAFGETDFITWGGDYSRTSYQK